MHAFPLLAAFVAVIPTAIATCNQFTSFNRSEVQDSDYVNFNVSFRVSNVVACTASNVGQGGCNATSCALTITNNQLVTIDRELNVTASKDEADQIFALAKPYIYDAENVVTKANWVYQALGGMTGSCFPQGQTAYFEFSPVYSCAFGTLSECTNGTVANGTVIRACGVLVMSGTADDEIPVADGFISIERGTDGQEQGPVANATISPEQADSSAMGISGIIDMHTLVAAVLTVMLGYEALL